MTISRDDVIWGFQLILGRDPSQEPKGDETINAHLKIRSRDDLIVVLLNSHEYKIKNGYMADGQQRSKMSPDPADQAEVIIFGNCQARRMAELIPAMVPELPAAAFELSPSNISKIHAMDFQTICNRAKHVVLLTRPDDPLSRWFLEHHPRQSISFLPPITFAGFHPDNDYVYHPGGGFIRNGPLGDYQSLLAFWAWKNRFDEDDAAKLFCAEIYDHVGYFEYYNQSINALLDRFRIYGYRCHDALMGWLSSGCFMHSINHPKLFVLADLTRGFLDDHGYRYPSNIEVYLPDPFSSHGCWPVYPEIGKRLGLPGDHLFKRPGDNPRFLSLPQFIHESYQCFSNDLSNDLNSPRLLESGFVDLLPLARSIVSSSAVVMGGQGAGTACQANGGTSSPLPSANPYRSLPDHCFWKKGVVSIPCSLLDPVVSTRFQVERGELVATAGSCFAQHIAKRLSAEGFNYYVPEDRKTLAEEERKERNYGVFSCRYGNLYTTRQLVQLFDRCMDRFTPKESAWQRADGCYVDPFRPQIEPEGFQSEEAMEASRSEHLACVKEMFEKLDILVFTLGLTESWESLEDGAVFPLAPGVAGGAMDSSRHRFRNLRAKEVADDLELFLLKLQGVNPKARVILTVSPVPLIATYEKRHVLVSNTHSKSVLRTVAGEIASRYKHCDYFPSYEIITGQHVGNGYLEDDLRSVRPEGVDHVMKAFLKHYAGKVDAISTKTQQREREQQSAIDRINSVICDEEAIEKNS